MSSLGSIKQAIYDKESRKQQYQAHVKGLNAYQRHQKFLKDYVSFYGKEKASTEKLPVKTDQDTLREGYRFIRTEEDDMDYSWEQRLVKRYYDKLFKEYCIADMSRYKTGKIGLRWRTEKEVISGKGQFVCGNKHCNERGGLSSYEVNFSYYEAGESKQALVKLVTCERCSEKLSYKRYKEKEQERHKEKEVRRKKRERSHSDDETDQERRKEKDVRHKKRERSHSDDETDQERHKEKEVRHKQRERSHSDDETDQESDRRQDRGKGKAASTSATNKDDDENFDEYLEGMFP